MLNVTWERYMANHRDIRFVVDGIRTISSCILLNCYKTLSRIVSKFLVNIGE